MTQEAPAAMEVPSSASSDSVKCNSRKRKKRDESSMADPNPLFGILTRSKSQLYFHHPNRSGIARRDNLPKIEPLEPQFLDVNRSNASIKDLRARRVFTPNVVTSVLKEEEEEEDEMEEEVNVKKGNRIFDSHLCNNNNLKVDHCDKSVELVALPEAEDDRRDNENVVNLKDQPISDNGSISKSKMAVSTGGRRKVFKSPSSLGFRRLLPYLMDILNDDSGVSEIEIVDAKIPHKLQKLDNSIADVSSMPENFCRDKVENVVLDSDQKVHTSVPCNQQDLTSVENGFDQRMENTRPVEMEHKTDEIDASGIDTQMEEECCQTTPPDPNIFIKIEEVVNGGETIEANNVLSENQSRIGRSNNVGLGRSPNGKGPNSVNRSVLNPCSRLKVFKNPKSLSFRRLYPFLMDMSKHNSCASRIVEHPKPQVDLNSTDGLFPATDSIHASSNIEPTSVDSQSNPEPCMLLDLNPQEKTQSQCCPSELELNRDLKENCSEILTKQSTSKESGPVAIPEKCSIRKIDLCQSLSQIEVSDALVLPSNGSLKGILKRNPRGCRGLCNCLNCASFRLHADRAFEFSRNQMSDAEEIALDLMKELASLRRMLEKSCANENVQLNAVKQACNRALETENLAKVRLTKLNDDLNIHCRIPDLLPPKVMFANHCQEKAIPMLDSSEKRG